MRMALTSEIKRGRFRVVVLLLDDCEIPIKLRHKLYLDFRSRFQDGMRELLDHLAGFDAEIPMPNQAVVAGIIRDADLELWSRLTVARGSRVEWHQPEVANIIRELSSNELEAALEMGMLWSGGLD